MLEVLLEEYNPDHGLTHGLGGSLIELDATCLEERPGLKAQLQLFGEEVARQLRDQYGDVVGVNMLSININVEYQRRVAA